MMVEGTPSVVQMTLLLDILYAFSQPQPRDVLRIMSIFSHLFLYLTSKTCMFIIVMFFVHRRIGNSHEHVTEPWENCLQAYMTCHKCGLITYMVICVIIVYRVSETQDKLPNLCCSQPAAEFASASSSPRAAPESLRSRRSARAIPALVSETWMTMSVSMPPRNSLRDKHATSPL